MKIQKKNLVRSRTYPKIHIFKITYFKKFTFSNRIFSKIHISKIIFHQKIALSKNHILKKSHFQILIFHKNHILSYFAKNCIFKISFFTKFTYFEISNSSEFMGKKCDFAPVWRPPGPHVPHKWREQSIQY